MTTTEALLVCVVAALLGRIWQARRCHQEARALFDGFATMVGEALDVYYEDHPPEGGP